MELLLDFVKTYLSGLLHLWPFIMLMVVAIAAIGFQVGKIERWTLSNAMYFAFVTAMATCARLPSAQSGWLSSSR